MSRRILLGLALGLVLSIPSASQAYFPPEIGLTPQPPVQFGVPGLGGLGEPEAPDPGNEPTVQTPEPASVITALTGLAMAGACYLRRRSRGVVPQAV